MLPRSRSFLGCAAAYVMVLACSSTDDTDPEPDASYSLPHYYQICIDLIDACHYVDPQERGHPISVCHQIGHDNVEDDCVAEHDRCVALCEAATPDAGPDAGDAGHADGGGGVGDAGLTGRDKCLHLGSVCHGFDASTLEECHVIGHDGDVDVCEENYDRCLMLCTEARGGG